MIIFKTLTFIFAFLILLQSCGGVKEGLAGNKRSKGADEFLVKKKNPLVEPPDYNELPVPKKDTVSDEEKLAESTNVEEMIKKLPKQATGQSSNTPVDSSLEKSILKEISKN